MGIVMELSEVVGGCDDYADVEYASDLTDTEEEEEEFVCTPRALERVVPRSSKRTYDKFLESEAVSERRKRCRIDEQIELLRAAIPNSLCTNEKASILAGAYEYIEKLQRQVLELYTELDTEFACSDEEVSSCEGDYFSDEDEERPVDSNAALEATCLECRGCSHPMIEVVGSEGVLRIHVECERRPHVLANIMEFLESTGMNADQVSIAYHGESQFVFDCVGSEVAGKDMPDSRYVEACLRSLISDQGDVSSQ